MLVKERLPEFETSPALELSKRPALMICGAGRITVDAREKVNGYYDALFMDKLQGFDENARREADVPGLPASIKRPLVGVPEYPIQLGTTRPFKP
jgi:hypothetical protein